MKVQLTDTQESVPEEIMEVRTLRVTHPYSLDLLSYTEKERAHNLRNEESRTLFVSGRTLLREQLARRLKCTPHEIELTVAPNGKPILVGSDHLHFNLSHTEGMVVLAIGPVPVGIDVERGDRLPDSYERLVERWFAPQERTLFFQLPPVDRPEAFRNFWVQKEAITKGTGGGLRDWERVAVSGDSVPRILADEELVVNWKLAMLPLPSNYRGAIAIKTQEEIQFA